MEGLTFRRATSADTERIAAIMYGEPSEVMVRGIGLGRADRARALGRALVRLPNSPQGWRRTVVAELDGEPVGVLQAGHHVGHLRVSPRLALAALRIYGIWDALKLLGVMRVQDRVQTVRPAGAYHVAELHVDPRRRNHGIGGALMRYAEEEARRGGYQLMSLQTHTTNPARHLYERLGFRVTATTHDPDFERLTGAAGFHLMVKDLT